MKNPLCATVGAARAPVDPVSPPFQFADKRAVSAMLGLSVRTVDNLIAKGMPHLKLGERRCRFDLQEVRAWLKQQYGTRRHGKTSTLALFEGTWKCTYDQHWEAGLFLSELIARASGGTQAQLRESFPLFAGGVGIPPRFAG